MRLVKAAKKLNIGTGSIVDHLMKKGYQIENKPTAMLTKEMYDELSLEFQNSLTVNEKVEDINIDPEVVGKNVFRPISGSQAYL